MVISLSGKLYFLLIMCKPLICKLLRVVFNAYNSIIIENKIAIIIDEVYNRFLSISYNSSGL